MYCLLYQSTSDALHCKLRLADPHLYSPLGLAANAASPLLDSRITHHSGQRLAGLFIIRSTQTARTQHYSSWESGNIR